MIVRRFVFGTAEDCDVRFTDEYMSAHHAVVEVDDDGRVFVLDLGSTNGVWWLGPAGWCRVHNVQIYPGDMLKMGHTKIPWKVPEVYVRDEPYKSVLRSVLDLRESS